MKAEMLSEGIITLIPESALEAYALKRWREQAMLRTTDHQRCEDHYWLGSKLVVGQHTQTMGPKE